MSQQNNLKKTWNHNEDRLEDTIDRLVLSVQFALQKAMHDNCVTQKELASRLGVSPARVSQILAKDDWNLTLKTIGKIADALGEEFELFALNDILELKKGAKCEVEQPGFQLISNPHYKPKSAWEDHSSESERFSVDRTMNTLAIAVGQ